MHPKHRRAHKERERFSIRNVTHRNESKQSPEWKECDADQSKGEVVKHLALDGDGEQTGLDSLPPANDQLDWIDGRR